MVSSQAMLSNLMVDLQNEQKHMLYYLRAASIVTGPHREEYKEFFLEEAKSELNHVHEFMDAIVYLGGNPEMSMPSIKSVYGLNLTLLLSNAIELEEEVAKNYTARLAQTEGMTSPEEAWIHLFYEDQLQDSWKAAQEMKKMISSL